MQTRLDPYQGFSRPKEPLQHLLAIKIWSLIIQGIERYLSKSICSSSHDSGGLEGSALSTLFEPLCEKLREVLILTSSRISLCQGYKMDEYH